MKIILSIIILALYTVGCATQYKTAEQREQEYYLIANEALKKNDCPSAVALYFSLLNYNTKQKINILFNENPNAQNCAISEFQKTIQNTNSINIINSEKKNIDELHSYKLLSTDKKIEADKLIEAVINEKMLNGSMKITFNDNLAQYKFLNTPVIQNKIAENTINYYKDPYVSKSGISELVVYISATPPNAEIRNFLEQSLPTMNLKAAELKNFETLYPDYIEKKLKESTLQAVVNFKQMDALVADDINNVLKKSIKGVEWADSTINSGNVITIEKIRHSESIGQERTQTISYADYQVRRLEAVLMMPRNASYLFDLITNEISIDYGYSITYERNGVKISSELVRGNESHSNSRCQYQRIQNVFGGSQPAGFIANDDMQSKCSGYSKNIDSLRNDIYLKISEKVLNIPDVKKVHNLN